jgi:hypothetical protein
VSQQTTDRSFDDLARALAEGSVSRRRALKLFAGTAIAALIPSRALAQQKETICHKPGTPDEKTMEVSHSAVDSHLRHGDLLGPCVSPTTTTTAAPTTTSTTSTTETPTTSTSTSTTSTSTSTTSTSTSTTSTTPMCRPDLSACSSPSQCCGGSCLGGTCCTRSGTTVTPTTSCCSRVSENGRCCSTSSQPCIINSDCCQSPLSQICINGQCAL